MQKTERILNHIHTLECMKPWKLNRLLGTGTIGTVFEVEHTGNGQRGAIKIAELKTLAELTNFENEVRVQSLFASYRIAPTVYGNCVVRADDGVHYYTAIIMEKMGMELDTYLTEKRSDLELKHVISQISSLFEVLKTHRLTHGDLALFNICFDDQNKHLKFIDFDRASSSVYAPHTDLYRIHTEFFDPTITLHTKPLDSYNKDILLAAVPLWAIILGIEMVADVQSGDIWYTHYRKYCEDANIQYKDHTSSTMVTLTDLQERLTKNEQVHVKHIKNGNIGIVTKVTKQRFAIDNSKSIHIPLYWVYI